MKTCRKCKEIKDIKEFSKNSYSSDGLRSNCKACIANKFKLYYEVNYEDETSFDG